jgi:hypothetical protein
VGGEGGVEEGGEIWIQMEEGEGIRGEVAVTY